MSGKHSPDWKWHVWHLDPVSKRNSWCGFFQSSESAMQFKKTRANPDEYRVNNVAPMDPNPRPVNAPTAQTNNPFSAAAKARRAEENQIAREQAAIRKAKVEQMVKQKAENDREMADIRKDAAAVVEKHKKDEAADLKAGINR